MITRPVSSSFRFPLGLAALALPLSALLTSGCTDFITGEDDDAGDEVGTDGTTTGDGDTGTTTGDGDTGTTTGTTTGDGDLTIYEIQQGSVGEGMNVTVNGVIVTSPLDVDSGIAFVEEPDAGQYSGISLYIWDEPAMAVDLQPGDIVDIVGEYAEFNGSSQIIVKNVGDIVEVGSAEQLPGPDVVAPADVARDNVDAEPWEGVRVQVADVTVAETNDGFGQILLQGDALVGNLYVDPLPPTQVNGTFAAVTGPLHYSFDEFKIVPPDAGSLEGYMDPEPPMDATPIYDIQQGMVAEDTVVKLEGVIATSGFTFSQDIDASFFVQEPGGGAFSGIQIFLADTTGVTINVGDELTITGTYTEFFDMSQVSVSGAANVTVTGSGPAPAPELIADPASIATGGAMAEDYEGVLVSVENVTVTDENPDAPDEFGEFAVDGDLRVDDVFFAMADWMKPTLGTGYASITGLLNYSFSNFKLEPRDAADLVAN